MTKRQFETHLSCTALTTTKAVLLQLKQCSTKIQYLVYGFYIIIE